MIEVKNLSKQFGNVVALDSVDFTVNSGEIVGLLGPNGAGKTTAMRIITGYYYPTSGEVFINNQPITENATEVKRIIGYLPENNPLYSDLTVGEYLTYIANVRLIPKDIQLEKISRVARTCGITDVVDKQIGHLSKGYKQRVGLSLSLIHDPNILILDEPTSGLDPNQIVEIRKLIKEIGKEKTIIISSHILPEVAAVCDRAIIIDEGKVIIQGTIDELEQRAEGNRMTTVILKNPPPTAEKELTKLSSVTEVVEKEKGQGLNTYSISSEADIREEIFSLAVANKWNLIELKEEAASLEDIFRELTRKSS